MSADWWAYVRRVGDDIAVKDFDVTVTPEALRALIAEELTDDRLDDLVQHMGRAFKPEITRRSGFTSELFPMLPYMTLSVIDDFHTYAERIAVIDAAMPAEEIGRRLRAEPGLVSPLWIWMIGYHYLCGRECLIQMGRLRPDERREEVRTVVDFWRRLTLAHRGDGTLDYKDAGFTNRYLPPEVVDGLVAPGRRSTRRASKALKRLNATVSGYSFLYFCDSRVGICDSGPYPRPDGRRTIVRDYLSLGPSAWGYPWAESLDPPFAGLTMALTFDPAAFPYFEINDWGTTFTEPDQLFTAVTEAAVIGHRADGQHRRARPGPVGGGRHELSRVHTGALPAVRRHGPRERIFVGDADVHRGPASVRRRSPGVLDQIDWSFSPDTRLSTPTRSTTTARPPRSSAPRSWPTTCPARSRPYPLGGIACASPCSGSSPPTSCSATRQPRPSPPISQADISWTEKLWASLFARDGSIQVDVGLGKYHNRNVIDMFAGISRGKEQLTVRASRQLEPRPGAGRRRPAGLRGRRAAEAGAVRAAREPRAARSAST